MSEGYRRNVYFSKTHDRDLIAYFKRFKGYPFAHLARELWRDGIKYRNEQKLIQKQEKKEVLQFSHNVTQNSQAIPIHSPTPQFSMNQVKEIDISESEIASKLDEF